MESVVVFLPGPKKKQRNPDGTSPGGLAWDNRVLLNAVLTYVLSNTSFKEAGVAGLSFLSRSALEVFVKAEPLEGRLTRRIDSEKPMPVFKPISPGSVRFGVFALEQAKNEEFLKYILESQVLNIGYDGTSVGTWSVQCVYLRTLTRVIRYTDGAGTNKLGANARSMCLDLKASGDKFTTQYLVMGEDGKMRFTSIEASDNFAAQFHQAGVFGAATKHRGVTVVSDGGGEGTGKGNRAVARLNMAGENSVGHLMWLLRSAGDNAFKMLNALGLWVPLYEAYGFDPLNGNVSTRKPEAERVDTVQRELNVAMRSYSKTTGSGAAWSSSSSSEDENVTFIPDDDEAPRSNASVTGPKPIYDPLHDPAPGDSPVQPMPFFDFLLWDIDCAYPELRLADTMCGVTEEMIAAVEQLARIMREESLPVDRAKCTKISIKAYETLRKGLFVDEEAINLVLEPVTHVLGGRFVSKGGVYTTGHVSPLIRSNRSTKACYVVDSQNAARLENCVKRIDLYTASRN